MNEPPRLVLSSLSSLPYVFEDGFALTVPEFLLAAFTLLEERFLNREGIFRKPGMSSKVKAYRVLFCSGASRQNGYSLESLSAFDLCDLIKLFFRELEEPLLTFGLQGQFLRFVDANTPSNVKIKCLLQLCHALPPRHKETLAFLMRKLHKVAEHRVQNKMDIVNVATVFAPVIFRDNESTYRPKNGRPLAEVMSASKLDVALKTEVIRLLTKACRSIGVLSSSERALVSVGGADQPYSSGDGCFKVPLPVRATEKPNRARKHETHHHITVLESPAVVPSSARSETLSDSLTYAHSPAQKQPAGDRSYPIDELRKACDNGSLLPKSSTLSSNVSSTRRRPTPKENQSARQSGSVPAHKPPLVRRAVENRFSETAGSADRRNVLRKCSLNRSNSDPISGSPKVVQSAGNTALGSRRLRRGRPNSLKAGLSGIKPNRIRAAACGQLADSGIDGPPASPQIATEKSPHRVPQSESKQSPGLELSGEFGSSDIRKASLLSMRKNISSGGGTDDEDAFCVRPSIAFIREHRRGMVSCAIRSFNRMELAKSLPVSSDEDKKIRSVMF